ncbi:glycerol-3-phosphate dehydrogenase [Tritrichomonas musculus]|uniref:Glycerol-3-phosphate dehydrogenase [NAD(+)] n=1 Tax=Tritrichomonas musculus TaxID=1915356 RepID=A0ABR2JNS9_9EUKA
MKRVGVIGSGNWGTTAARLIAENVQHLNDFDNTVKMWVFDEKVHGESLVKIINTAHENVKYLPGYQLPETLVAYGNVRDVLKTCNYLVFVLPHQFLEETLKDMVGHVREGSVGISLIKGVTFLDGEIELVTDTIERMLHIKCGGLMGANIANDIANRDYCESTISFPADENIAKDWQRVFNSEQFQVQIIDDLVCQQLCGTLKNIVATAGGLVDGMGYGQSTKAAIMRRGFVECYEFAKWYYPNRGVKMGTMMESCGFADIVASSYGGRNRKCAEFFVKTGKTFEECEMELLNGQKLQGVLAAAEIYKVLKKRNAVKQFPLFAYVHLIDLMRVPPQAIFYSNGKYLDVDVE